MIFYVRNMIFYVKNMIFYVKNITIVKIFRVAYN